jgi:CubicO group peptidase (beta-lactamase class C family)
VTTHAALDEIVNSLVASAIDRAASPDTDPGTGRAGDITGPTRHAGADTADLVRAEDVEGAPAAVAAVSRADGTVELAVAGRTITFDPAGHLLDEEELVAAGSDLVDAGTLFDMASVTKVVTTLIAATFIEEGLLDPEAPAAEYAPVTDPRITVHQLLTHTSGLPPTLDLWHRDGGRAERFDAIAQAPLRSEPGTAHAYSCIGFLQLTRILEALGSAPLPRLARERVLDPAGMRGATWTPDLTRSSVAATEYQSDPPRGMVRGEVHDETAWSLSTEAADGAGVGNAGLFATATDALALGGAVIGRCPISFLRVWTRVPPGTRDSGCVWDRNRPADGSSPRSPSTAGSPVPGSPPIPGPGRSRCC